MISMKMSDGSRVVVPVEIRRSLGIVDGDTVLWNFCDGVAQLTTRRALMRQAQATVRQFVPANVSLADEIIAERRAENAADEGQQKVTR